MDVKQDFHTLKWDEFKKKYHGITKYKARKLFGVRYKQKSDECSEQVRAKRLRQKEAQDRYTKKSKEDNAEQNKIIADKFGIDKDEIRELRNNYGFTEILNGEMVNGKLVVRDMFRVVRN